MVVLGASDFVGEQTLEEIIQDIYDYLQKIGVGKFNRFLGRKRADKCAASWTHINIHLTRFVENPKQEYSRLMSVIEEEKQKFSTTPEYAVKLDKLSDFLRKGPKFSQDYHCKVRMPNGFEKRRLKIIKNE